MIIAHSGKFLPEQAAKNVRNNFVMPAQALNALNV